MPAALEIRKTLDVFKQGELVEIRAIGKPGMSGYFRDFDNLLRCAAAHPNETLYFVLNKIQEQCYAKAQRETLQRGASSATSDSDIARRHWVLIDADPVRASGISASREEKRLALGTVGRVHDYLRDIGFAEPVVADSGNGYHLLYRVVMANDAENTETVRRFLMALDMLHSSDAVKIDTAVFNASRITKLYGTWARKGANTQERPHRQSRILRVPDDIGATSADLFKKVAAALPEPGRPTYKTGYAPFDLRGFLRENGIAVARETAYGDGTRLVLEACPFNPAHKAPDAAIFETRGGAIGFKCFHNACANHDWKTLRALYDPGARARAAAQPRTTEPARHGAGAKDLPPPENRFLQLHEIAGQDRARVVSVRSGIEALDRKIIGFNKGELSVWSGGNGAGKSTLLLQLALDAVQQGFKAAVFSGELPGRRVKEWAHLIAAGRQFTAATQHEGVYCVDMRHAALIDEWCKGKLWLYDNAFGASFFGMRDTLQKKAAEDALDVIIIDNLMSLDLREMPGDKWERQTQTALSLAALARESHVHIHFVCHPRKESGFLRKADISGTADLTNVADNVFMAHRVNRDFERQAGEFFGRARAQDFMGYDNVVECMKNRDLGANDHLVGLYFEPESKRFLNRRHENKAYGWVDLIAKDDWVSRMERDVQKGRVQEWNRQSP